VTIKGRTYQLLPTGDQGENDQEVVESIEGGFGKGSNIPSQDMFAGKVRRIAKTNILDGQPRAFASVGALRDFLPKDPAMANLGIGRDPASDRVEQEKLNVTLTAYIYAFRKESDNDYHVIMGDAPNTPNPRYVNAEVSGIPNAGTDDNRNQLWAVRKAFQQAFQLGDQGPDAYFRPHQPVPVRITGSLFWDVEHYPQTVGPRDFAPKTAWEIHPISEIEFLN
jgi:hypothetical protein